MNSLRIFGFIIFLSAVSGSAREVSPSRDATPGRQTTAVPSQRVSAEQQLALTRMFALEMQLRVAMGIELRPFGTVAASADSLPPHVVRLPVGTSPPMGPTPSPRQALDEFLVRNEGYESVARGGILSVRPVGADVDPANWLNAQVPAFDMDDVTVLDALVGLGRRFDPAYQPSRVVSSGSQSVAPVPAAAQQRFMLIGEALQRRMSVHLSNSTVRGVLDAIVAAHGEAGWVVSFKGTTPSRIDSRIDVVLWKGSVVSAFPLGPPRLATQPQLLYPLPLRRADLQSLPMRVTAGRPSPMGLELGPECLVATGEDGQFALDLTGLDIGEALPVFLTHCGGYEFREVQGVLNIGPRGSFEQSCLNLRAKDFHVKDIPLCDTLADVVRIFDPRFAGPAEPLSTRMRQRRTGSGQSAPANYELLKPVTLQLRKVTVREILNALVTSHGSASWTLEEQNGMVTLTFQASTGSMSMMVTLRE
jgi:hypothetical protein